MTNTKRIAKNTVVQGAAFGAQGVNEFVVALVLARLAGAERLGEFTTLIILAGLFAFISAFGLPGLLVREVSRIRDDRRRVAALVDTAVGLVAVLSLAALLLMLAVGVVLGYSAVPLRALFLVAIALGIESVATVVAAAFRGVEALERSSAVTAAMEIGFMLFAVGTVVAGGATDAIMAARVASRLVALALALRLYVPWFGPVRPRIDLPSWRALLRDGLPFSVNSVFSSVYSRADIVLLSLLAGDVVVGYYEVAYEMSMRTNIVARAITFALYPVLALQFARDRRSMRAYAASGIHYLNIAGFLIAAILWFFGEEIVSLVYGRPFGVATRVAVKVLALAIPLRFAETQMGVALDASNRAGRRATGVAIAAVTNAGLNVLLIPLYSMMGAVYATVITEVVICLIFAYFLRDEARELVAARAFLAPTLGVGAVAAGFLLLHGVNTWAALSLSVVLYGATILALDQASLRPLRALAGRRVS